MIVLVFFLLSLLVMSVQSTVTHALGLPDEMKAPLALPLVVYGAFRLSKARALVLAFAAGYTMDVLSGGLPGVMSFASVVLCLGGFWLQRGFLLDTAWGIFLVGSAFGASFCLISLGLEALFGLYRGGVPLKELFVQTMMIGLLSPPMVWLAGKIDDVLQKSV